LHPGGGRGERESLVREGWFRFSLLRFFFEVVFLEPITVLKEKETQLCEEHFRDNYLKGA